MPRGALSACRSALLATGGQARVRDLIQLLTAAEAADLLGMSLSYAQHAARRGEIPVVLIGKRDPRYRVIDLIGSQEERRRPAESLTYRHVCASALRYGR